MVLNRNERLTKEMIGTMVRYIELLIPGMPTRGRVPPTMAQIRLFRAPECGVLHLKSRYAGRMQKTRERRGTHGR